MNIGSFGSSHRGCVECGHTNQIGEKVSTLRLVEFTHGKEWAFAICTSCLCEAAAQAVKFVPEWNRPGARWDGSKFVFDAQDSARKTTHE